MRGAASKGLFVLVMGGLTGTAVTACRWQYNRYLESKRRWDTIFETLKAEKPYVISSQEQVDLPWAKTDDILMWEYKLVKIRGRLKKERYFIRRYKEGRLGYVVLAPLITASFTEDPNKVQSETGIIVNLGWVPHEYRDEYEKDEHLIPINKGTLETMEQELEKIESELKNVQINPVPPDARTTEIVGLVRRGEKKDYLYETKKHLQDMGYTFIYLPVLVRAFGLQNTESASVAFLEKIQLETDDSEELYPVPATKNTFLKPYLTPEKHAQYATFWAGCTIVGSTSILSVLGAFRFLKKMFRSL